MDWLGANTHGSYSQVLEFGSSAQLPPCDKPNDVMIKVTYSDVNPVDLQKLSGGNKEGKEVADPPFIPGFGGTGVVEQVGGSTLQHLVGKAVCFVSDPSLPHSGSYASHVVVDSRCIAELPSNVDPRDAATVPIAGLTAYEILAKLGLARDTVTVSDDGKMETATTGAAESSDTVAEDAAATLLVVGASGGVGSWILTLMAAWHPHIRIIATASSGDSQEWCKQLGASQAIGHNEVGTKLEGGKRGSVDHIVCLAEPTAKLFDQLSDVIKPYGQIALVVAGKSIESINLGFCFFKCVNIITQTVFSSMRTNYQHIVPSNELKILLRLMGNQTIRAPLSPDLESVSDKMKDAMKDNGVLARMTERYSRRGKFVLSVNAGDSIIFLDFKTSSIIPIPRKDCIKQQILSKIKAGEVTPSPTATKSSDAWKEEAKTDAERTMLIEKVTSNKKIGIVKITEKTWSDYEDGIEMQEAENVKNLWGVQLKKREKNKKGEELLFVDLRSGAIGEISRKSCMAALTIDVDDGKEVIAEAVIASDERENIAQQVRQALKLHLEPN